MDNEIHFKIKIPTDDDGFVLLKCSHCGTFFKLTPYDIEDDGVLSLFCPCCGLTSENFITDDVSELAYAILSNFAVNSIFDNFDEKVRTNRNNSIKFKVGKRPNPINERLINSGIHALNITTFQCCDRNAKVKPLLIMTGCYCPFCGVRSFETQ